MENRQCIVQIPLDLHTKLMQAKGKKSLSNYILEVLERVTAKGGR